MSSVTTSGSDCSSRGERQPSVGRRRHHGDVRVALQRAGDQPAHDDRVVDDQHGDRSHQSLSRAERRGTGRTPSRAAGRNCVLFGGATEGLSQTFGTSGQTGRHVISAKYGSKGSDEPHPSDQVPDASSPVPRTEDLSGWLVTSLLRPAVTLMNRLRLARKFLLLSVLLLVPLVLALWSYHSVQKANIDFAKDENTGVRMVAPLDTLVHRLADARARRRR